MLRPISKNAWMATAAALLVALIVAAGWWNGGAWGGPRFLGRPARDWFPRYAYDGRWGDDDAQRRWSQLTGAGPKIMPMLLAAARESGDESVARYSSLRRTAPPDVQVWLPEAIAGDELRREIGQILRHLVRKPDALRAFASVYASVPALARFAAGELPGDLDLVRRGTDGTGRGFRRAGWTFGSDATTAGDAGPRVVADLSWRTGRTNEWPLTGAQRARTDLQWRAWSASMGVPPGMSTELMRRYGLGPTNTTLGAEVVLPVTLRELAAEALRRIEGGTP